MKSTIKKKEGFQGQRIVVIPKQVLNSKCLKNELISSLFITDIGYYPYAKFHYIERPKGAEQWILIYCYEGKGVVTIQQKEYKLEADDFIIIPQKAAHSYLADELEPWSIYWIHFKGSLAHKLIPKTSIASGYKDSIRYKKTSINLFEEIYGQLEKGYSNDNLTYANMCLWHFLSTFIYNSKVQQAENHESKDSIDLVIDYLSNHINESITLEEIASEANLSPSHFSYLFKNKTGFSPMVYFNHLKVQKACQFLLFTQLRVKEISQEVGIEDQYYFSRMFSKIMGMSPNEYRLKKFNTSI